MVPVLMLILGALATFTFLMLEEEDDEKETEMVDEEVDIDDTGNYQIDDDDDVADDQSIIVNGDDDNNTLQSGAGDDVLSGGGGLDVLLAGDGVDVMYGGADTDTLTDIGLTIEEYEAWISGDLDDLSAEEFADAIGITDARGGDNDAAYGGEGDDEIYLFWGADEAYGGDGDDYIDVTDFGAEAGADTVYGGAGEDRFELDDGDTAMGGAGADFFSIDGFYNDVPDLQEDPVVIVDFDPDLDEASYYNNWNEQTDSPFIPITSGSVTVQDGSDVVVGADIPDANGDLDGVIDFTIAIFQNSSEADIDAAIEAGTIYTVDDL